MSKKLSLSKVSTLPEEDECREIQLALQNWGGKPPSGHETKSWDYCCPECTHDVAPPPSPVESLFKNTDGFSTDTRGKPHSRIGVLGVICPKCKFRFWVHLSSGWFKLIFDQGKWPKEGIKKGYTITE